MTILYPLGSGLYVNVTNKCPCRCTFCIRSHSDHILESDSLWFEGGKEPTAQQIIDEFKKADLSQYDEIVFCGYGEPLCALDTVVEVMRFLKGFTSLPLRINTNGLSDLINSRADTALLFKGLADTVSVSLNAPDSDSYDAVTNTIYPGKAFDAVLKFAQTAKSAGIHVIFTVVDVIDKEQIERCKKLSDDMGIELRVREYIDTY